MDPRMLLIEQHRSETNDRIPDLIERPVAAALPDMTLPDRPPMTQAPDLELRDPPSAERLPDLELRDREPNGMQIRMPDLELPERPSTERLPDLELLPRAPTGMETKLPDLELFPREQAQRPPDLGIPEHAQAQTQPPGIPEMPEREPPPQIAAPEPVRIERPARTEEIASRFVNYDGPTQKTTYWGL